jgi:hypothetical protein
MNFEYDVFISHEIVISSNDQIQAKWTENLTYFLNLLLNRLTGKEAKILTSKDLVRHAENSIENPYEILTKVSVFIIVLTNEYLKSETCRQELQTLFSSIQQSLAHEKFNRIIKVLKYPISIQDQPKEIQKILNFEFFIPDGITTIRNEIGSFFASDIERHFWYKLIDLAYEVFSIIATLDGKRKTIQISKTIYLAECCASQQSNRDNIKRELLQHGYKVLPDKVLSKDALILRTEIINFLGRCCLSIHVMGEDYGELLNASDLSIVDLQNTMASDYYEKIKNLKIAKESSHFTRIIWIPPDLKPGNEKQRSFIQKLKLDTEALKGADVLEVPIELLKSIIHKQTQINSLADLAAQPEEWREKIGSTKIYLIFEREASEQIVLIEQWLTNIKYEIWKPDFEGDKVIMMKTHREKLIKCDAVIVYFNSENTQWLASKLLDLIKAPGYGRTVPFRGLGLYTKIDMDDFLIKYSSLDLTLINEAEEIQTRFSKFISLI